MTISAVTGMLVGGLKLDHEHGYGGEGQCPCFAAPEAGEEGAEGLHSGVNGHGEEHTNGGVDEHLHSDVLDSEAASEGIDN